MKCRSLLIPAFSLALLSAGLRADTVYLAGQEIGNAQITKIENGQIYFILSGREVARELTRVVRLNIDNEPALNAAEQAYVAGKFDDAADGYQKALRSARKEWIRDYVIEKLLDAGGKSKRFDAAASAYIQMLLRNPAKASENRPTLPDEKSTYLATAATDVETALKDVKLTDDQRISLLSFLVDLQTARRDAKAIETTSARLDEVLARNPSHPDAGRALARRKLQSAATFLAAKNYDKARSEVEAGKSAFTDPQQQAEALWILAEVTLAQADATKPTSLKDAALAYMRIPAHFSDTPGKPHVAASLMKAAEIAETLKESQTALLLYQQVQAEFADTEFAPRASAGAARVKSASKP